MQSVAEPSALAMHRSARCGARTRAATPCRSPAMPNGRCRMHGGTSPGAPLGNQRAFKHGVYGREMNDLRTDVRDMARWAMG